MIFSDNISDFYHWMVQFGNVNARSRTNYISWLKFMAGRYEYLSPPKLVGKDKKGSDK